MCEGNWTCSTGTLNPIFCEVHELGLHKKKKKVVTQPKHVKVWMINSVYK